MKHVLLFFVIGLIFITCKKSETLPAGTSQINGVLHFDNTLGGGLGLYYVTDSNKYMIFKNEFATDTLQFYHYRIYVNVNTTLTYKDDGETGCYSGTPSLCGFPLVEIVKFTIR